MGNSVCGAAVATVGLPQNLGELSAAFCIFFLYPGAATRLFFSCRSHILFYSISFELKITNCPDVSSSPTSIPVSMLFILYFFNVTSGGNLATIQRASANIERTPFVRTHFRIRI